MRILGMRCYSNKGSNMACNGQTPMFVARWASLPDRFLPFRSDEQIHKRLISLINLTVLMHVPSYKIRHIPKGTDQYCEWPGKDCPIFLSIFSVYKVKSSHYFEHPDPCTIEQGIRRRVQWH